MSHSRKLSASNDDRPCHDFKSSMPHTSVRVPLQILGICFITLSLRDDETRRSLLQQLSAGDVIAIATAKGSGVGADNNETTTATPSPPAARQILEDAGGGGGSDRPPRTKRWKFKRFDLAKWKASQRVEMGTEDAGKYFK